MTEDAPSDKAPITRRRALEVGGTLGIGGLVGALAASKLGDDPSSSSPSPSPSQDGAPPAGSQSFVNVKDHGAVGDGVSDDTAAINAAIDAAVLQGLDGRSEAVLFPAGVYRTMGEHVLRNRCLLVGHGKGASTIQSLDEASGEMFRFTAPFSGIRDLHLQGGQKSGDGVVFDAGNPILESAQITDFGGNGVTVGKSERAIGGTYHNIKIKDCRGYGVWIGDKTGSTDGMWTNFDIGRSGKSAFYIGAGAQLLVNVHVWGSGLYDSRDNHGFYLNATQNCLTNCESEKNNGNGIYVAEKADANRVLGGMIWANVQAGILAVSSSYLQISTAVYDNGIGSTDDDQGEYSAIQLDGVTHSLITGCYMYDRGEAFEGGSSGDNPYPGKPPRKCQTYAVHATNGSDKNIITGNVMDRGDLRVSGQPLLTVGAADVISGNVTG